MPIVLILDVGVDKKTKVMINSVTFEGNSRRFLKRSYASYLSKTRERKFYNIFGSKKFKEINTRTISKTWLKKCRIRVTAMPKL